MVVSEIKTLKVDIDGVLKDALDELLEEKRMKLNAAIEGMIRTLLALEDDTARSVMLGQVRPDADMAEYLVRKFAILAKKSTRESKGRKGF